MRKLLLAFSLAALSWGALAAGPAPVGKFTPSDGPAPDGTPVQADLPRALRMKNSGGNDRTRDNPRGLPGKGYGLCVTTSVEHAGRLQNEPLVFGLQKKMEHEPGGSYPRRLEGTFAKHCAGLRYVNVEVKGKDTTLLELALKTGRMPAVTYDGRDGVFYAGRISHMVNLVYLDSQKAAILDNNNPGKILWMTRVEFLDRWSGWLVVLLSPRPPPPLRVG